MNNSRVPMIAVLCVAAFVIVWVGTLTGAPSPQGNESTKVEGVFVLPKDLASFQGRVVEVRLYQYDPRIADKAADLVEKLDIKEFAHKQGQETTKAFTIGAKGTLEPKMGYYVTLFVLDGGKRTHMGECEHSKNNLCKVLTSGQPTKIKLTVRAVQNAK